jgi:hypothetical protein
MHFASSQYSGSSFSQSSISGSVDSMREDQSKSRRLARQDIAMKKRSARRAGETNMMMMMMMMMMMIESENRSEYFSNRTEKRDCLYIPSRSQGMLDVLLARNVELICRKAITTMHACGTVYLPE